ncbi:hypothetical protein D9R06_12440 [Kocuria marina subsp. indica]|uniref:Uncharacterized protein n=1 Tax=Kocuria marina subsp. indica TaxID=1049583 RepID=A0A1X7E587_9MICC|nr:hypothetical protein B1B07_11710 [Kocuria indica]RLP56783.1 hypothetical protein D9R06_12440 [Kocuria indica]SMF27131.1 hypothetical protein SAMN06296028_1219 [Kocuria indica]
MSASTCEGTNVLRTRVVLPRTSARTVNEFNAPMWNSGAVAPPEASPPREPSGIQGTAGSVSMTTLPPS